MTIAHGIDVSVLEQLLDSVRQQSRRPYPWSTWDCNRICQLHRLTNAEFIRHFGVSVLQAGGEIPTWHAFGRFLMPLLALGGPEVAQSIQKTMIEDYDADMARNFEQLIHQGNFAEIVSQGDEHGSRPHNALARVIVVHLQHFIVSVLLAEEAGHR